MSYNRILISDDIRNQKLAKARAPRKKSLCERLDGRGKRFFILFLDTSSIHGLNHFTKIERHPIEIVLWIGVVGLALWGAVYLSMITWDRYQDSPTVVSMDRDMFSWNTTFPCVTVCPHTKLDEKKLSNYIKITKPKDETALEDFIRNLAKATYASFNSIPEYPSLESKYYMPLLLNLSMNFNPTLTIGASGGNLYLEPTITELGLCYAINSKIAIYNSPRYRADNRWDLIEGNETFYVHPLDGEIFAQIINLSTGYDVFIHGPLETPDIATQHQVSDNELYMKVYVTALSIYTSPDAAQLRVLQRKCRFVHESNLVHSPVYSYNLCRIDCRISLCIRLCGCVPHFYRTKGKEKVCDVAGLHCLSQYKDVLFSLYDVKKKEKICECLPNCNDVNYILQSMASCFQYFSLQHWFLGTNFQWGIVTYPKLRFRRDIIFGFTDVLVSVGGMAGLFLGCSVLSFIEIIYFYTLRLFWYLAHYNKNEKTKNNELQFNTH